MGDFTILTPKEPIFDEIDFGQKITKNTIKEKACAKNQGFRAKKDPKTTSPNRTVFYALYIYIMRLFYINIILLTIFAI